MGNESCVHGHSRMPWRIPMSHGSWDMSDMWVMSPEGCKLQTIADRVAQNRRLFLKTFKFVPGVPGFIIYYLVLIVNPMGRILVCWQSCRKISRFCASLSAIGCASHPLILIVQSAMAAHWKPVTVIKWILSHGQWGLSHGWRFRVTLWSWSLRWSWVFFERTWILSGIQFTTHFIEFFVVETHRFVGSFVNVILSRQTCGQRSSKTAESKRRAPGNYFFERICYMFLEAKCRGDWDLSLCTTSGLVFGEPRRNGKIRFFLRRNTFFSGKSPLRRGSPNTSPEVVHRPRSQCSLHFDFRNIQQIRSGK